MKVCLLSSTESIHTIRWANALNDKGINVHILTQHPLEHELNNSIIVKRLPFKGQIGYYLNSFYVRKYINQCFFDIVHAHYASGYGTLLRISNIKKNTILSVWGSDVYLFPKQSKIKRRILQKNLKFAKYICSTSNNMKQETQKYINSKEIFITPFGINTEKFSPQKIDKESFVIGTIKKMSDVYGIDILLRSFAKFIAKYNYQNKNISLLIVGGGPQLEEYKLLSRELNIDDKTTFTGQVSHEQVVNYYNQIDIFCALSRSESFGVSVLEASSSGVPVIVSNVGGLPEVVLNNKTGYIVNNEDLDMIIDKMQNLYTDHKLHREMSEAGIDFVKNNYSWENSVDKMINIYDEILNEV